MKCDISTCFILIFWQITLSQNLSKNIKRKKYKNIYKKKKIYAQRVEELIDKRKNFAPRVTN